MAKSSDPLHRIILSEPYFYSATELIDLLFPAQEHQFSIPQISDCLEELGLTFCGFDFRSTTYDSLLLEFRELNPSPDDFYDLGKWSIFESRNPLLFSRMYNFWCQKKRWKNFPGNLDYRVRTFELCYNFDLVPRSKLSTLPYSFAILWNQKVEVGGIG